VIKEVQAVLDQLVLPGVPDPPVNQVCLVLRDQSALRAVLVELENPDHRDQEVHLVSQETLDFQGNQDVLDHKVREVSRVRSVDLDQEVL